MSEKVYVEQSAVLEALQAAINKQAGKPDALQFVSDILDAPFVPPPASVAPIVRCKDCRYWKDRYIKQSDGTERQYKNTDDAYVSISVGINVSAACHYDDVVFRDAEDYCSRGEPRPCPYEQWWGIKNGVYTRPRQED